MIHRKMCFMYAFIYKAFMIISLKAICEYNGQIPGHDKTCLSFNCIYALFKHRIAVVNKGKITIRGAEESMASCTLLLS